MKMADGAEPLPKNAIYCAPENNEEVPDCAAVD